MDRWLTTQIQYEDNYTIKDVVELLTDKVWNWIDSQEDLYVHQDYFTFKEQFIKFLYITYK